MADFLATSFNVPGILVASRSAFGSSTSLRPDLTTHKPSTAIRPPILPVSELFHGDGDHEFGAFKREAVHLRIWVSATEHRRNLNLAALEPRE
jgi:hypothetical protein